jgi:hypothetical protein
MGRRRKSRFDLPPRLYEHHGSYWYRPRYGKPINLGKDLATAKRKWAELEDPACEKGSLDSLIDWYLAEVAPMKAPRTFSDNKKEAVYLKKGLGHIPFRELRPHHIATYRDARAKDAPVRANREKALLSHVFTKAMERGWVKGTPFNMPEIQPDVALAMVQFGSAYVCIFGVPQERGQYGAT